MWIARDKNNTLRLFRVKPFKLSEGVDKPTLEVWDTDDDADYECMLDSSLFPNIKWENEPMEVELTYKNCVNNLLDMLCDANNRIMTLEKELQERKQIHIAVNNGNINI